MAMQTEEERFLQLIEQHKGIIIRICNIYCSYKSEREDLYQEIIYTLWKGRRGFNPAFKFSTWMYRVGLNVAISFYRLAQKKINGPIIYSEKTIDIEDKWDLQMDEQSRLLHQEILKLKELDRALILLYLEGRTYKEIADIIGITETNVATKLSRIKEKLKKNINPVN